MTEKQRLPCPECGLPVPFDADLEDISYEERLCNRCHERYEKRSQMNPNHIQQYLPVQFFKKLARTTFCNRGQRFLNRHQKLGSSYQDIYTLSGLHWILWLLTAVDDGLPGYLRDDQRPFVNLAEAFLNEVLDTHFPKDSEALKLRELYAVGNRELLIANRDRYLNHYDDIRFTPGEEQQAEEMRVYWQLTECLLEALNFKAGYLFGNLQHFTYALQAGLNFLNESDLRAIWDKHIPFDTYRNTLETAFSEGAKLLL